MQSYKLVNNCGYELQDAKADQDCIDRLKRAFAQISDNLPDELRQKSNLLCAGNEILISSNMTIEQLKKVKDKADSWCVFLTNEVMKRLKEDKDYIFQDIVSPSHLDRRFKTFSLAFHPDKASTLFTKEILGELQNLLIKHRDIKSKSFSEANFTNQIQLADQCIAESNQLPVHAKKQSISMAIIHLKKALVLIDDNAKLEVQEDKNIVSLQIEVRIKIADCYEMNKEHLSAQIYILAAIEMARRLGDKKTTERLSNYFSKIKNTNLKPNTNSVSLVPYNNSKKTNEFGLILPELNLVESEIANKLIQVIETDSKKSTIGTVVALAGAAPGGAGLVIAGGISLGGLLILSNPIGWVVGGALLLTGGLFSGYKIYNLSRKFSNSAQTKKDINFRIDNVKKYYCSGEYQKCIDELANQWNPLIHYDKKNGPPIKLYINGKHIISQLLDYGFRPDGIAFLINLVAEILLTGKIETAASEHDVKMNIFQLLIEVMYSEELSNAAKVLDQKLHHELYEKKSVKERFKSAIGMADAESKVHIEDYKIMTISQRLQEVQNIVRVNYAIMLFFTGRDASVTYGAHANLNLVEEQYDKSCYFPLIQRRIELVQQLIIAFDAAPQKQLAPDSCAESEGLKEAKALHAECLQIADQGNIFNAIHKTHLSSRLEDLLKKHEQDNNFMDARMSVFIILDRLQLELSLHSSWKASNYQYVIYLLDTMKEMSTRIFEKTSALDRSWIVLFDCYSRVQTSNKKIKDFIQNQFFLLNVDDVFKLSNALKELMQNNVVNDDLIEEKNNGSSLIADEEFTIRHGLALILQGKLDPFAVQFFQIIFEKLSSDSQLENIHDLNINNVSIKNSQPYLKSWKKYFSQSYELYREPIKDQIISFLTTADGLENNNLLTAIKFKLSKHYGDTNKKQRQQLFAEIADYLRKNNNFKPAKNRLENFFADDYRFLCETDLASIMSSGSSGNSTTDRLRDTLHKYVIGQSYAVNNIARVLSAKDNTSTGAKPRVFLFCGPTGIGKTELSKAMSVVGFPNMTGSNQRFIRFDMQLYPEQYHSSSLWGSPTGYVGSSSDPFFEQKILPFVAEVRGKQQIVKNIVILFDEIEKAHKKVNESLMGLLDTGVISIRKTVKKQTSTSYSEENIETEYYFENCFIVCTSNLFAKNILTGYQKKLSPEKIIEEFKKLLSVSDQLTIPEAVAARMQIIPFGPIPKGHDYQKIILMKIENDLAEFKSKFGLKDAVILGDDAQAVLKRFEDEFYRDGVDIRFVQMEIRRKLEAILCEFEFKQQYDYTIYLKFDSLSKEVYLSISVESLFNTVTIDQRNGVKFNLTNSATRTERRRNTSISLNNIFVDANGLSFFHPNRTAPREAKQSVQIEALDNLEMVQLHQAGIAGLLVNEETTSSNADQKDHLEEKKQPSISK